MGILAESVNRTVAADLRASLGRLMERGACLLKIGPDFPVPIPLNECVILRDNVVLWATCHTAYGSSRPCVGRLEFDYWRPNDPQAPEGLVFGRRGSDHTLILPVETIGLSQERASRLRADQSRHRDRAARDPVYARRWAQGFHHAADSL